MEAAIAARRADLAAVPAGSRRAALVGIAPDDDLEAVLANRRRERAEKAAGFCPQCGYAVRKSDKFCPKCGASLD
jgi:rubrerythrin